MTVQRILDAQQNRTPVHVAPDAVIADVLRSIAFEDIGAIIVSSDGSRVEGIISEHDIVRGLRTIGPDLLSRPVRDLMTVKVATCVPNDPKVGIMALMVSKHVRHLPVVTDGKLVGMVSIRDLLKLRLDEVQSDAEAMRNYIAGAA